MTDSLTSIEGDDPGPLRDVMTARTLRSLVSARSMASRCAVLFSVVIGAMALAPPVSLGASPLRPLASALGTIRSDGRFVVFSERQGEVTVLSKDAPNGQRFAADDCRAVDVAAGRVLLACTAPRGPALMDAASGVIRRFAPASGSGAHDGFGVSDSFFFIGRYWAAGQRDLGDTTPAVYLNLASGAVTLRQRARDLDDPHLHALPSGPCGGYHHHRYGLSFARGLREVRLVNCRRHRSRLLERCPRRCTGGLYPPSSKVALWTSLDGRRLYVRRIGRRRACVWNLPAAVATPIAFLAAGQVYVQHTPSWSGPHQLLSAPLRACWRRELPGSEM
jgi:hypothetical protein